MAPATLVVFLMILCLSTVLTTAAAGAGGATGIRMKLTHRFRRAITFTRQRLASMRGGATTAGVSAPVHWATQQYIAEYVVGSPPQRAEALLDTGSDLIWTQSTTCLRKLCARQDLPYFNSSASSTFSPVPCRDASCAAANSVHLCALDGSCEFLANYGAGGIIGALATDAFVFGSGEPVTLAFGCVSFVELSPGSLHGASGLVGLGRGRLSLVSQLDAKRFSYCLTPYFHNNGATSHLFVGAGASLSSGGGVTTSSMAFVESPKDYPYSSFYYLPLIGITVGETRLAIPSSAFELRRVAEGFWIGGVVIDSGSPFTALADAAYQPLTGELSRQLNASLVAPPGGDSGMELCVPRGEVKAVVPAMVFHVAGGADMVVPPENYWAPVDKSTACLAILDGFDQNIIGNFQQQNLHLLFDVGGGKFYFQTADCSTL
nr:unnamed protein product [Digitaria exilis]